MQVFIWLKEHSICERFFALLLWMHVCIKGALGSGLGPGAYAPETAARRTGKI